MEQHAYVAIDLKSFYASVECVERGLDPLTTNLVVADESRTQKTICLAVSPSLKAFGIPGRPRLFEVIQKVKGRADYIIAPPRMALYIEYSTKIYGIYLKYIAPEDIHVYSIDEVFMDVTAYLETYKMSARDLAAAMIREVLQTTGITATAGIGTNLYLAKIAMDIVAKHTQPDEDGVRIAKLDEAKYRRLLWDHRPLTDFWRIGKGYAKKLEQNGLYTMGDIARCSIGEMDNYHNEELLYKLFGINAELLIDHSWGWEPCTIADIKAYKPESKSIGSGQVLQCPYDFAKARIIVQEMADAVALDLVSRGLVAGQMVLTVNYDAGNLADLQISQSYKGPVSIDRHGHNVPKHAHGTASLGKQTSSSRLIVDAVLGIYDRVVDRNLFIRRVYVTANHVADEKDTAGQEQYRQLDLFTDYEELEKQRAEEEKALEREKRIQLAVLAIKKKFGKNAILKGTDLEDGATAMERNRQIGGHKE